MRTNPVVHIVTTTTTDHGFPHAPGFGKELEGLHQVRDVHIRVRAVPFPPRSGSLTHGLCYRTMARTAMRTITSRLRATATRAWGRRPLRRWILRTSYENIGIPNLGVQYALAVDGALPTSLLLLLQSSPVAIYICNYVPYPRRSTVTTTITLAPPCKLPSGSVRTLACCIVLVLRFQ